jgi:hypothetical protein
MEEREYSKLKNRFVEKNGWFVPTLHEKYLELKEE